MYINCILQPRNVHNTHTFEDSLLRSNYLYLCLLGFNSKIGPNTHNFIFTGISLRKP